MMEFVCFSHFSQLPHSADALFRQAEQKSVFVSRPWFENLAYHALGDRQHMLLACVIEKDSVLAILPLARRDSGHCHSLGHRYTSLYSLLLADRDQEAILTCLVNGLSQLSVTSLRLYPVDEDDSSLQQLQHAFATSGFTCHQYFRFYNWIYRLRGQTFKEYMAARPSRVRNTIARKQRKLEREHGYKVAFYDGDNLQQMMADYHQVYRSSWKAKELYSEYVDDLAKRFSDRGWLRLAVLYINEQPAAAQLWFVAHGRANIFRLAYDEAWKQYSPGSILLKYLMERVIDTDNVEEIDFLTGNDAYKQDWMSDRRERWEFCFISSHYPKNSDRPFTNWIKGKLKQLTQQVYN